jgi:signal transduction histidine kinase
MTRGEGDVVVTVANSGPVLSPQTATDIFQPFMRGAATRTGSAEGSGLGLSIVATIAAAHKARVHARPLVDGGLEVSLTLPTVASDGPEL